MRSTAAAAPATPLLEPPTADKLLALQSFPLGSLSRRAIARKINVHHSLVSRILSGERRPSFELASEIAPLLKMTLDQFYATWQTVASRLPSSKRVGSRYRSSQSRRRK